MKIIAFGDIHMEYQGAQAIPGLGEADLVIITGDLTNFGHADDARKVLDGLGLDKERLLALHGNLDHASVADLLAEMGVHLHGRGRIIGEVGFFGIGGSNLTPFNTPSEHTEEEISSLLEQGFQEVKEAPVKVMVSHAPPKDTQCDVIAGGVHVGSEAVRRFIEEKQPAFCLTGHIHEAKATDRIGETVILNPGMLKDGGWILCTKGAAGWQAELKG